MPTPTPRVSMRTRRVALACLGVFIFSVVTTGLIVSYLQRQPQVQRINYSQLYSLAETGGATALTIEGETVTVTRPDGSIVDGADVDVTETEWRAAVKYIGVSAQFDRSTMGQVWSVKENVTIQIAPALAWNPADPNPR